MPIFRPKSTGGGGNKFMGIVPVSVDSFGDRSDEFDWADLFIEVTLKVQDSEYTKPMRVAGSLDKDTNGKITGGSVLSRLYNLLDAVSCKAGLNVDGSWEDEEGNIVDDIYALLNDKHTTSKFGFPFVAYIYKSKPKNAGEKSYTRVHPRLFSNDDKGKKDLQEHITWMKSKGFLKEADASDLVPQPNGNNSMSEGAIGNL